MSKFSIKINLMDVPGAQRTTLQDAAGNNFDCVVIPVNNGYLFPGEKGVYLNAAIMQRNAPSYGWTHAVKVSATSEFYKSLTEEQRKTIPFIGDMKPLGGDSNNSGSAAPLQVSKPNF